MAMLKFRKSRVMGVLSDEARSNPRPQPYCDGHAEPEHGILLVGDEGVYLMPNGRHEDEGTGCEDPCYAEGITPSCVDWYDEKCNTFGGDDGAIFIPLYDAWRWAESTNGIFCKLRISPDSMEVDMLEDTDDSRRLFQDFITSVVGVGS